MPRKRPNKPNNSTYDDEYLNVDFKQLSIDDLNIDIWKTLPDSVFELFEQSIKLSNRVYKEINNKIPGNLKPVIGVSLDFLTAVRNIIASKNQKDIEYEGYSKNKNIQLGLKFIDQNVAYGHKLFDLINATAGIPSNIAFTSMTSVASFAAAAVAWGVAAKATFELTKTIALATSPALQIKKLIAGYDSGNEQLAQLANQIQDLQKRIDRYSKEDLEMRDNAREVLMLQAELKDSEGKLKAIVTQQEKNKFIAMAIAQKNNKSQKNRPYYDKQKNELISRVQSEDKQHPSIIKFRNEYKSKHHTKMSTADFIAALASDKKNPEHALLLKQIEKNQRNEVIKKTINVIAYSLSAVGATLMAISPFCAVAAPALMGVGITLCIISSSMLAARELIPKVTNFIASKVKYAQLRKEKPHAEEIANFILHLQNNNNSNLIDKLNEKDHLKLYLAYNQYKDHTTVPSSPENWYQNIQELSPKKYKKLLNNAEKEFFDKKILTKTLKISDPTNPVLTQIPAATAEAIVKRALRQNLYNTIKKGLHDGYLKGADKVINVNKLLRKKVCNLIIKKNIVWNSQFSGLLFNKHQMLDKTAPDLTHTNPTKDGSRSFKM